MNTKFTLVGFVLFCSIMAGLANSTTTNKKEIPKDVDVKLHQDCLYPIIQVLKGEDPAGTGFVIRSDKLKKNVYYNLFVTCEHVTGNVFHNVVVFDYEDWSYISKKTTFPCVFYGVSSEIDVALGYFLSDRPIPTVKLDTQSKMYIGSEIFKIGCGRGMEPRVDFGKITLPLRHNDPIESFIRHSATTIFGDSGGPLFYKNKVVGIINRVQTARDIPIWQYAYAIPINRVNQWSKSNHKSYDHVFENNLSMPKMPKYRLELSNKYEITD